MNSGNLQSLSKRLQILDPLILPFPWVDKGEQLQPRHPLRHICITPPPSNNVRLTLGKEVLLNEVVTVSQE